MSEGRGHKLLDRPLIGVTGPDTRWPISWWFIRWALLKAGARACRMTPKSPRASAALDGVIISGGDDIDPSLYLDDDGLAPMDNARDQFEIATIKMVLDGGLPIMGICRGAQLLNVVLGGNLYTDIRRLRRHTNNRRTPLARKTLRIKSNSQLRSILQRDECRINSLHHQAIKDLGEGLVEVGHDLDNFIQAVEHPGQRFMMGVQWHPEYLPFRLEQGRLFKALVDAAKQRPKPA